MFKINTSKLPPRTLQSKIVVILAIISIILSTIKYREKKIKVKFNFIVILTQVIIYYIIASEVDCLIYGKCYFKSWFFMLIPSVGIIIFILDTFNILENIKRDLSKINITLNRRSAEIN